MAPGVVHPASPLAVMVHLLRHPLEDRGIIRGTVRVTLSLMRGDYAIEKVSREMAPPSSQKMEVPVPNHLMETHPYSLLVKGEHYLMEGPLFQHKVPLKIFKAKHKISLMLNSKIFTGGNSGEETC